MMIDRTERTFALKPKRLIADTAYGTGGFLGWLVKKTITPHIPVWDMSKRKDGAFSRFDFTFDKRRNLYICPAGKTPTTTGRVAADNGIRYRAAVPDCRACPLPTVSDRALQRSAADVLSAIYEQDFLPCSFGGRPRLSAHHALATLNEVIAAGYLRHWRHSESASNPNQASSIYLLWAIILLPAPIVP
jgi:hypothetical protein